MLQQGHQVTWRGQRRVRVMPFAAIGLTFTVIWAALEGLSGFR